MIKRICQYKNCKKEFYVYPSCPVGKGKYCQRKCHDLNSRKYTIKPRKCRTCGVVFNPPQRGKNYANSIFCSAECKYSNLDLRARSSRKCSITRLRLIKEGKILPPWNKGLSVRLSPNSEFKKGNKPWNRNKKGIHLSPKSEFAKGHNLTPRDPIGTLKVRKSHDKHPRFWIKVGNPNKWMYNARYVWEQVYGKIPRGYVIHHKNRNTLDDDIDNLDCLTKAEHIEEHRGDLLLARSLH